MVPYVSPLRYPGGKAKLGPYFARVLASQSVPVSAYAEPYAGGAGAGLYLLSEGHIDKLYINDLNPGIAAFWRSVLERTDELCEHVQAVEISVESWTKIREIYLAPAGRSDLELGFATFFLNRCNRSGILNARPIGGLEQTGRWKIDARFNRSNLVSRIQYVGSLGRHIEVSEMPALKFLAKVGRRKSPTLLYVDPPYLVQGEELYMRVHSWQEHEALAKTLARSRHPWILTYDTDDRVRELYPGNRCLSYSISHTAQSRRIGSEYMLFSRGLRIQDETVAVNRPGVWLPALR